MFRLSSLMIAAAIALPLPASAASDCAARIAAMESHPGLVQDPADKDPSEGSSSEHAEEGVTVEENGGTTVYQEGGPAMPRESWFVSEPDKAAVIQHLEAAKQADAKGDAAVCAEEMDQAEEILVEESIEEQQQDQQAQ